MLENIVDVQISRETRRVSQQGFGTLLILDAHKHFNQRIKYYSSLTELVADNFDAMHPVYQAAQSVWSQNPSPAQIAVGRIATEPVVTIEVCEAIDHTNYHITLDGETLTVNSGENATTETIALELTKVIQLANNRFTAMHQGSQYTVTPLPLRDYTLQVCNRQLAEISATETPAAALTAIREHDDNWYAIALTDKNKANLLSAAQWAESHPVLFGIASNELGIIDSECTEDIANLLHEQNYDRSFVLYHQRPARIRVALGQDYFIQLNDTRITYTALPDATIDDIVEGLVEAIQCEDDFDAEYLGNGEYHITSILPFQLRVDRLQTITQQPDAFAECAWFGRQLPTDPGSTTWAFKTLTGINTNSLASDEERAALNKFANLYQAIGGAPITREGTVASGEYLDVMRGIDWLTARIGERVYNLLVNQGKVPYTDAGIAAIEAVIHAQLMEAVENQVLSPVPEPVVTVPRASDINPQDKANRILKSVDFTATLAGAIHHVQIRGRVVL